MTEHDSISVEEYYARYIKPHKYGAQPAEVDNIRFASKAEARRYSELKLLEASGDITNLVLQPRYDLTVEGTVVARYYPDFSYWDHERNCRVVEDVKASPTKTPVYRLKKKMMQAQYGIEIEEVQA